MAVFRLSTPRVPLFAASKGLCVLLTVFMVGCFAAPTPTATSYPPLTLEELYRRLLTDAEALERVMRETYENFKTARFSQGDVRASDMDIDGFLTATDLPSMPGRLFMGEEALLPKHQLFLRTYELVMIHLKGEELRISGTTSPFITQYDTIIQLTRMLLVKLDELMTHQDISDGPAPSFVELQWVPGNDQVHNVRSLYILQSINDYLPTSIMDYQRLMSVHINEDANV